METTSRFSFTLSQMLLGIGMLSIITLQLVSHFQTQSDLEELKRKQFGALAASVIDTAVLQVQTIVTREEGTVLLGGTPKHSHELSTHSGVVELQFDLEPPQLEGMVKEAFSNAVLSSYALDWQVQFEKTSERDGVVTIRATARYFSR